MNKAKRFLSIALAICSLPVAAQKSVAIYQTDGQVATFAFTEKPVVTYSGSDLVLTTTETCVQYPIYNLQKMEFPVEWDNPDAVREVKETDATFSFLDGQLSVSGGKPGAVVLLYNMKGIKAGQYCLDENGHASIPTGGLQRDIYIVKCQSFTFKFRKQ